MRTGKILCQHCRQPARVDILLFGGPEYEGIYVDCPNCHTPAVRFPLPEKTRQELDQKPPTDRKHQIVEDIVGGASQ